MGKPSVRISEMIGRPVEDVFAFFSNMENSPRWGRTLKTKKDTEGPISVGTVFREESKIMGKVVDLRTEVVEYNPPTNFSYSGSFSSGIEEHASVTFESVGNDTRFTIIAEAEMGKIAQLLSPIFSRVMKRQVTALFGNLRRVLEAPA